MAEEKHCHRLFEDKHVRIQRNEQTAKRLQNCLQNSPSRQEQAMQELGRAQ